MKGGASVRYHLVAKVLVLRRKSNGFMGGGSEAMVCKSVSFTEEKKWFYEGGASVRYHLVTKVLVFSK